MSGILRDIFTMGARPVAQLNSLRFGNIELDRTKWLVKGVTKGIGDYGNAFGIPIVGGEVFFDDCYNTNPLVNAFSAGIMKKGDMISATSSGVGNPVFIVGSRTGKDGIHGASFASKDITEDSANDLPYDVQQDLIALNEDDNLQNEVDAFLENQYSLLSRNFSEFITRNREPTE